MASVTDAAWQNCHSGVSAKLSAHQGRQKLHTFLSRNASDCVEHTRCFRNTKAYPCAALNSVSEHFVLASFDIYIEHLISAKRTKNTIQEVHLYLNSFLSVIPCQRAGQRNLSEAFFYQTRLAHDPLMNVPFDSSHGFGKVQSPAIRRRELPTFAQRFKNMTSTHFPTGKSPFFRSLPTNCTKTKEFGSTGHNLR